MKHVLWPLFALTLCTLGCASAPAPQPPQLAHALHPGEPLEQVSSARRPFDPRFGCPVNLAGPNWHACKQRELEGSLDAGILLLAPDEILARGARHIGERLFAAIGQRTRALSAPTPRPPATTGRARAPAARR